MTRNDLIRCPKCGSVNISMEESGESNCMSQSAEGIRFQWRERPVTECWCKDCEHNWTTTLLKMSNLAGQPVTDDIHSHSNMLHWYPPGYGLVWQMDWEDEPK